MKISRRAEKIENFKKSRKNEFQISGFIDKSNYERKRHQRNSWLGFRCEILGFEGDFLRFDNFCEDFEDSGKNRKFQKNREKIRFKFLDLLINSIMSENAISGSGVSN